MYKCTKEGFSKRLRCRVPHPNVAFFATLGWDLSALNRMRFSALVGRVARSRGFRNSLEGYLLDSGIPYRLWFGFGLDSGVKNPVQGNGLDGYGLLHEAGKELAPAVGSPPVESELELIQVVIEMLVADRSLVGSHQPPFEEADHAVNSRH